MFRFTKTFMMLQGNHKEPKHNSRGEPEAPTPEAEYIMSTYFGALDAACVHIPPAGFSQSPALFVQCSTSFKTNK